MFISALCSLGHKKYMCVASSADDIKKHIIIIMPMEKIWRKMAGSSKEDGRGGETRGERVKKINF